MFNDKKFLAIIPARAGSKRLTDKNILPIKEKPLISWSIEASINSSYINTTVVTSDSSEILKIAKKYEVKSIQRPEELSRDESSTIDVVLHVLEEIKDDFDYIILLQPTSPLRTYKHINEAVELFIEKEADAVISVSEMEHSPLWSNTLDDTLNMEGFLDTDILNKRSQNLPSYYRLNGAIYICNIKKLLKEKTFFLKRNIYAYKMERKDSIDIDEEIDFRIAELLFE